MKFGLLALVGVAGACSHCGSGAPGTLAKFGPAERAELAKLSPPTLPGPPPDRSNRFADDARAAALGQKLFFDPGFSGKLLDGDNDGGEHTLGHRGDTGKVSCAACHVPSAGFLDSRTLNQQISLAAGWGKRRAPSLLDAAQAPLLTWDGRRDAFYNQPFGVIESPVEANSSRLYAAQQMARRYRAEYEAVFGPLPPLDDPARFPQLTAEQTGCHPPPGTPAKEPCPGDMHGVPGDKAEYDGLPPADQDAVTRVVVNMGKALGAYVRKLTCGPSRFDRWVRGQATLTASEERGAALFIGKGKCATCHSGPFMSDQKFHNVGLRPEVVAVAFIDLDDRGAAAGLEAARADPLNTRGKYSDGDDGRLPAVVAADMEGAFRTPGLRCVSGRPSFMHTGQLRKLEDVVAFFSRGGESFGFPGTNELKPLDLTDGEQADLVAFLKTLDGPGPERSLLAPPP